MVQLMPLSPETLAHARSYFPHTLQKRIYLNHAGTAPLSAQILNAMTSYYIERSSGVIENFANDMPKVAETRMLVRRLINAESTDRIAFTMNTSDAINIVASGIDWKSGDRVLLNTLEFPANVFPYLNLRNWGVEIDTLQDASGRMTPAMIEAALTGTTRLLALSAVQFLSGFRADLETIGTLCRDRGVTFVVDGIQAVGAVAVDVQRMKIDALATGCQKWQLAPHGTGYLYLTEELQGRLRQRYLGWLGMQEPFEFFNYTQPPAAAARRYEGGTLNIPGIWGLHAALTTIHEFGIHAIEEQILHLTDTLARGLAQIDGVTVYSATAEGERAGIVTVALHPSIDAKNVFDMLLARGIAAALRDGKLRYSPHFYNSTEEMHQVVDATEESILRSSRTQH